jgi:hypothetical protein
MDGKVKYLMRSLTRWQFQFPLIYLFFSLADELKKGVLNPSDFGPSTQITLGCQMLVLTADHATRKNHVIALLHRSDGRSVDAAAPSVQNDGILRQNCTTNKCRNENDA